jgi:hypothetical protein
MEMCLGDKDFPKQKGPLAPAEHLTEQRYAPHDRQVSPDKDVNFRYTTAAFTLSPEPWALLRGANLPGDWALYAISVPRIESGAGLAHSFALRLPSDATSR